MTKENQEKRETTHARIYTDNKERVANVLRAKAFKEKRRVTEAEFFDSILNVSLPVIEKELGI